METPEYRRDHDRLGHVVMVSAGRDPLLDPLMGASRIKVDDEECVDSAEEDVAPTTDLGGPCRE